MNTAVCSTVRLYVHAACVQRHTSLCQGGVTQARGSSVWGVCLRDGEENHSQKSIQGPLTIILYLGLIRIDSRIEALAGLKPVSVSVCRILNVSHRTHSSYSRAQTPPSDNATLASQWLDFELSPQSLCIKSTKYETTLPNLSLTHHFNHRQHPKKKKKSHKI